jgi:hypothetical protein
VGAQSDVLADGMLLNDQEAGMDELAPRRRGRHDADPIIAAAIASGATQADAAREADVSLRTVTRRVGDPSFCAQIADIRARSFERVVDALLASAATAITTLVELLEPNQPPAVRLNAARTVLSATLQYRSTAEVPGKNAPPAVGEDLESKRRRARQIIEQVAERRMKQDKAALRSGHFPPDPPSCINDHAAGECADCSAWQDAAHKIATDHGIGPDGCLTAAGSFIRGQVWPLRPATIQLLNAAHSRRAERSAS